MKGTCVLVVAALVAACGKSSKKQDEQTFAAAMKIICEAGSAPGVAEANPAERNRVISEHVDANVTNPEARMLFESIGVMPPAKASAAIDEAARKAGIEQCALIATSVAGRQVTITASAIVVEGHDVPPDRVEPMVAALVKNTATKDVTVAIEPDVPYARVVPVLQAIVRTGARPVLLDDAGGVPLATPTPADPLAPQVEPDSELGMLVMITSDRLSLASTSGLEGTVQEPLFSTALDDPEAAARALATKLTEIVDRRWPAGRERSSANRQLIVMPDASTPARVLLPILAAARRAPDGRDLFPDVALAVGFE